MNEKEFYERCAYLLGAQHEYREPPRTPTQPDRHGNIRNTYKSRYNGRDPGNGRFPGSGIIRNFGALIQVNLTNPPLSGRFKSFEEALIGIDEAMAAYVAATAAKAREEADEALKDNPVGYRIAGPEEIDISRRNLQRANQAVKKAMAAR